jgi:hypothetical protein
MATQVVRYFVDLTVENSQALDQQKVREALYDAISREHGNNGLSGEDDEALVVDFAVSGAHPIQN